MQVLTFLIFSTWWNIAEAKVLQGSDFRCPLVERRPRDGSYRHQENTKVRKRSKGVVLHETTRERVRPERECERANGNAGQSVTHLQITHRQHRGSNFLTFVRHGTVDFVSQTEL